MNGPEINGRQQGSACKSPSCARGHREEIKDISADRSINKGIVKFKKILQNFSDFPSHQIFRRMHGVLNIDENKNYLHNLVGIDETNLLSLGLV